jgi:hypothetical protein
MRGIRYAAASRFHKVRLWNTESSAGACHRAAIRPTRWRTMTPEITQVIIARHRVGAKRRPMTGSAKQSMLPLPAMDCFVAIAPRNDDQTQLCDLAAWSARSFPRIFRPRNRGRREDRVRAAPAVSHARCTKQNAHEHTGSAEAVRPSLRNGFNGFLRALPGDRALLSPSSLRSLLPTNLTPASGRQDHTTSPSALARSSCAPLHPPHPAPYVRDDREPPLL